MSFCAPMATASSAATLSALMLTLAVLAEPHWRDHRHVALLEEHLQEVPVDPRHLAHLPEVASLLHQLARPDQAAVLARDADGERSPVPIQQRHQLGVDGAGE